mmetsp:Transcript_15128/g.24895  ORF Transcript_15128/g.24895 Transcript_15128/m.24895 type:complete len:228 (+) Transcript_15128:956-1639(+)
MYLRYSSRVVAPIQRSSPRPNIGFSRFPASIAPSFVAPAPTTVWISSMKRMTWPADSVTSLSTAFRRSSNSPRYLAPAMRAPISRAMRVRPCKDWGTSPDAMRCARPSAMAVLPTPGSPIRTGLFFVRLERICMVRRISSSRPITGSSLPSLASLVRSRPYFSSTSYFPSGFWSVTRWFPRTSFMMASNFSSLTSNFLRKSRPKRSSVARASIKCSTEINSSLNCRL